MVCLQVVGFEEDSCIVFCHLIPVHFLQVTKLPQDAAFHHHYHPNVHSFTLTRPVMPSTHTTENTHTTHTLTYTYNLNTIKLCYFWTHTHTLTNTNTHTHYKI